MLRTEIPGALLSALNDDDIESFQSLIKSEKNFNIEDNKGRNLFIQAVCSNKLKIIKWYLSAEYGQFVRAQFGESKPDQLRVFDLVEALGKAVEAGNPDLLGVLLADERCRELAFKGDDKGRDLWEMALNCRQKNSVLLLLKWGGKDILMSLPSVLQKLEGWDPESKLFLEALSNICRGVSKNIHLGDVAVAYAKMGDVVEARKYWDRISSQDATEVFKVMWNKAKSFTHDDFFRAAEGFNKTYSASQNLDQGQKQEQENNPQHSLNKLHEIAKLTSKEAKDEPNADPQNRKKGREYARWCLARIASSVVEKAIFGNQDILLEALKTAILRYTELEGEYAKRPRAIQEQVRLRQQRLCRVKQDDTTSGDLLYLLEQKEIDVVYYPEQFLQIFEYAELYKEACQAAIKQWININIKPNRYDLNEMLISLAKLAADSELARDALKLMEGIYQGYGANKAAYNFYRNLVVAEYKREEYEEKLLVSLVAMFPICDEAQKLTLLGDLRIAQDRGVALATSCLCLLTNKREDFIGKENHLIAHYAHARICQAEGNAQRALVLSLQFLLVAHNIEDTTHIDDQTLRAAYGLPRRDIAVMRNTVATFVQQVAAGVTTPAAEEKSSDKFDANILNQMKDGKRKEQLLKLARWQSIFYTICRDVKLSVREDQALPLIFNVLNEWSRVAAKYKKLVDASGYVFSVRDIEQIKSDFRTGANQALTVSGSQAAMKVKLLLGAKNYAQEAANKDVSSLMKVLGVQQASVLQAASQHVEQMSPAPSLPSPKKDVSLASRPARFQYGGLQANKGEDGVELQSNVWDIDRLRARANT